VCLNARRHLQSGSEASFSVELWWRCAALQALSAYVLGVVGKGLADDVSGQIRVVGELLLPLLDAVCGQPGLADPGSRLGASASPVGGGGAWGWGWQGARAGTGEPARGLCCM